MNLTSIPDAAYHALGQLSPYERQVDNFRAARQTMDPLSLRDNGWNRLKSIHVPVLKHGTRCTCEEDAILAEVRRLRGRIDEMRSSRWRVDPDKHDSDAYMTARGFD
jgi:hypothetical protein